MTDRELTGAEAQAALSEAIRRTLATKRQAPADTLRDRLLAMADELAANYGRGDWADLVREASALVPAETGRLMPEQCEDGGLVAEITAVVRDADRAFEKGGGGSRHWVRDWFLPKLNAAGMVVAKTLPPTFCRHCHQEIRFVDDAWRDCETHRECGEDSYRRHAPALSSPVQPDPVTPSSVARGAGADVREHPIWRLTARIDEALREIMDRTDSVNVTGIAAASTWLTAEIRGFLAKSPAPLPDAAPSASAETGTPWRGMDSAPKDRPIVVLSLRGNAYTVTHEDVWWFAKNVGRTFRTTDLRVWTDLPSSTASGEETP